MTEWARSSSPMSCALILEVGKLRSQLGEGLSGLKRSRTRMRSGVSEGTQTFGHYAPLLPPPPTPPLPSKAFSLQSRVDQNSRPWGKFGQPVKGPYNMNALLGVGLERTVRRKHQLHAGGSDSGTSRQQGRTEKGQTDTALSLQIWLTSGSPWVIQRA